MLKINCPLNSLHLKFPIFPVLIKSFFHYCFLDTYLLFIFQKHVNGTIEILLKELEILHSNNTALADSIKVIYNFTKLFYFHATIYVSKFILLENPRNRTAGYNRKWQFTRT